MTTIEHAFLGVNLVLATGLERRYGWQLVVLSGFCAVVPDWDALTIIYSFEVFGEAHRVWGHNLLVCILVGLFIGYFDYFYDIVTRVSIFLLRLFRVSGLGNNFSVQGEDSELCQNHSKIHEAEHASTTSQSDCSKVKLIARTGYGMGFIFWLFFAVVSSLSHLLADVVSSGAEGLPDWELKLLVPFSDRGFVYPLHSWGDVGVTLIFIAGMFAMLKWQSKTKPIAILTLLAVTGYILY
jgi:hypothetical protein